MYARLPCQSPEVQRGYGRLVALDGFKCVVDTREMKLGSVTRNPPVEDIRDIALSHQ